MKHGYKGLGSLFLICWILWSGALSAQVFWTEDFSTGCNRGNLATSYTGTNGSWTVTNTGTNDSHANQWFVSAAEGGMGAGNCGDDCMNTASVTDRTLHISNITATIGTNTIFADSGARYYPGGACFPPFNICGATDRRVESPVINCTGQAGITLSFNYIEGGNALDEATLWYNDGTTWALLDSLPKTLVCGSGVGQWTAFSIAMPASADNNANVQIGFRWKNNDDGVGTDPSFAVDDITLSVITVPPGVNFIASDSVICEGACINFSDLSTNSPTSWQWTFTGAATTTSTLQNPTGICYPASGFYDVKLVATNSNGSDSLTKTLYIEVQSCGAPVANFIASDSVICTSTCINFTDLSTGNPVSWQWTFQNAFPATSTAQNPASVCYGTSGTHTVQLVVDNGTSTDTIIKTITVNICANPVANFAASDSSLCISDCISFTDLTTGGPTSWEWSFPGATPSSSFAQNPTGICYTSPGTYAVTLIAANNMGSDTMIKTSFITVVNCVPPTASFSASSTSFCANTCINFTDLSANNPTQWNWSFPGATPSASTQKNPTGICYNTPGTYAVTLIATNAYGSDVVTQNGYITVNECLPPIAGFKADTNVICANDCINFQDTSKNGPTSWNWSFPGSLTPNSNVKNPANICYPVPGTYTVSLIAQNSLGANTVIRTDYIIVENCVPPVPGFEIPDTICERICIRPNDISEGVRSWEWHAPGAIPPFSTDSTPFFCFPDTGDFTIKLITYNPWGEDSVEHDIRVGPTTKITINPDTITINLGGSTQLGGFTLPYAGTVYWTPIASLDCDTCINPIARPLIDTEYILHFEDSNGCISSDTLWVFVTQENVAVLPDAFSPNGDGENDFLYVRGVHIKELHLMVYDRYGKLMWETQSVHDGWSGQYNGHPVNSGVYFWHLNVGFDNGERRSEKGRIVLVR